MKKTQRKALAAINYELFRPEQLLPAPPTGIPHRTTAGQALPQTSELTILPLEANRLPAVGELYSMFDLYNAMYFGGQLPEVSIEYSTRMTAAGSYTSHRRLIKLGVKYHQIFPSEVADTLKHEMLHIKYPKHNSAFKREAERVGASVKARAHPLLSRPPRYIYVCPGCKKEYPRQKRLRMASCGDCSANGKFDPGYKLRLVRDKVEVRRGH